jgi:hypothetical protein
MTSHTWSIAARAALFFVAIAAAGCFSPQLGDGDVACGVGDSCPPAYRCNTTLGRCFRQASTADEHDLAMNDQSVDIPTDLAGATGDLALADLAHPIEHVDMASRDLATPPSPDMTNPSCSPTQSCNDNNCSCNGGGCCSFSCSNNTKCAITCNGGSNCSGTVDNKATATINCNDSTCEYTCNNNSTCQVSCGGSAGSCLLKCNQSATCMLTGCAGAPTEKCADGTLVCHHACP